MSKFQALNPDRGDLKAGSMIVLSDPNNTSCTYQEAQLMQTAQQVKAALDPLTSEEAEFMFRHGAEIASFTGHTSTWLGVSAAVMEKHLIRLRDTLQDIERLHQETYRQHGNLRSKPFCCRAPAPARPVGCPPAELHSPSRSDHLGRSPQIEDRPRHFQS